MIYNGIKLLLFVQMNIGVRLISEYLFQNDVIYNDNKCRSDRADNACFKSGCNIIEFYIAFACRNKGVLKILNLKFIKCMKIKSASIKAEKLIITDSSTKEDYKKILSLNVGDVFKVEGDYETCLARIEEVRAETEGSPETFGVCPITPGTSLFTVYGPQHLIVTDKM